MEKELKISIKYNTGDDKRSEIVNTRLEQRIKNYINFVLEQENKFKTLSNFEVSFNGETIKTEVKVEDKVVVEQTPEVKVEPSEEVIETPVTEEPKKDPGATTILPN